MLTVSDRIALLHPMPPAEAARATWCTDELLKTHAARARLASYVAAGFPAVDVEDVMVMAVAEPYLKRLLLRALHRLPACVQWHVHRSAMFLLIGCFTGGFQGVIPAPEEHDGEATNLLVISGSGFAEDMPAAEYEENIETRVAHEAAHSWLEPPYSVSSCEVWREKRNRPRARPWDRTPVEIAADPNGPASIREIEDYCREVEVRAVRLTAQWGFGGPAADLDRAGTLVSFSAQGL